MPKIGEKVTLEFEIPAFYDDYKTLGTWDPNGDWAKEFSEVMECESRKLHEFIDETVAENTHSTRWEVTMLVTGAIAAALKILD